MSVFITILLAAVSIKLVVIVLKNERLIGKLEERKRVVQLLGAYGRDRAYDRDRTVLLSKLMDEITEEPESDRGIKHE